MSDKTADKFEFMPREELKKVARELQARVYELAQEKGVLIRRLLEQQRDMASVRAGTGSVGW